MKRPDYKLQRDNCQSAGQGHLIIAEKIRTLFREQRITIASILTAIGMVISVLVEVLLPGGSGVEGGGGKTLPEDEKGLKE